MQTIRERLGSLQEPSQRKLRLFAVACCREVWSLLKDHRSQQAVQIAEAYADGLATKQELTAVANAAWAAVDTAADAVAWTAAVAVADAAWAAAVAVADAVADAATWAAAHAADATLAAAHAADATLAAAHAASNRQQMESNQHLLLDDIFVVSKKLRVSRSAQQIAQNLYDTRDFASLPILADYLEDQGCQDQDVLTHCRSNLPHAKGCWALDTILGKH